MGLSSRVVWELHCDAVGCGSWICGSSAGEVQDHAFNVERWERIVMSGGGNSTMLIRCPLHRSQE